MAKELTLKQTGCHVTGTARLLLWGDDEGAINMNAPRGVKEKEKAA